MDVNELYRLAKEWTLEAGTNLRQAVVQEVEVEYKTSAADLVTQKDKEIERFFSKKIKEAFPDHFLLGEEGVSEGQSAYDPQKETVWLVDPIDGTTNFVHNKRNFSISVGVYHEGEPLVGIIYDVMSDEMFHVLIGNGLYVNETRVEPISEEKTYEQALIAMNHLWLAPNDYLAEQPLQQMVQEIRGFRCIGSAALELAYVAVGRFEAAIFNGLGPWDFGAASVLLQEQGVEFTTVSGDPVNVFKHSSVLTATKTLHGTIQSRYIELK